MTAEELHGTIGQSVPPAGLPPLVEAMWWQARGDWRQAHQIAQDIATHEGAWVHAHLHRSKGDLGNAGYWYREAGRPAKKGSLEEEWAEIAQALLRELTDNASR